MIGPSQKYRSLQNTTLKRKANICAPFGIFFFFKNLSFLALIRYRFNRFTHCSLLVSLYHTLHSVTASRGEYFWGGVCCPKMYGGILITFVSGRNESGADGGGAIALPGTFLLWVSLLLDGTLSSGLVSGNPCNRQERGVAVSGDGMLLGGPPYYSRLLLGGGESVMETRA